MYAADLSLLRYSDGCFDFENWACPLLAVGWLDYPHPFNIGKVRRDFFLRLSEQLWLTDQVFMNEHFRGLHECSLCSAKGHVDTSIPTSYRNMFVPGDGVVYVVPGGITHYIELHRYAPPDEFVTAVLQCPDLESRDYIEALTRANNNTPPPLEDDVTIRKKEREKLDAIIKNRQISGDSDR